MNFNLIPVKWLVYLSAPIHVTKYIFSSLKSLSYKVLLSDANCSFQCCFLSRILKFVGLAICLDMIYFTKYRFLRIC